jgi:hypothetical protein
MLTELKRRRPWLGAKASDVVVVGIAKNEADYLLEWIAYHRLIGVDHFVIYDNDSTDGSAAMLSALARHGIVTVVPWPSVDEYAGFAGQRIGPQIPAYSHGLDHVRAAKRWRWVGVLDLDEFVIIEPAQTLSDFLKPYATQGAVGLNWRMFGSSHLQARRPGLMIKNLTWRASDDFTVHRHVKSFALIEAVKQLGIHIPEMLPGYELVDTSGERIDPVAGGLHDRIVFGGAWINHYFTKTVAEAESKRLRGKADYHPSDPARIRRPDEFTWSDRNEVQDLTILRWEAALGRELSYLALLTRWKVSARLPGLGRAARLLARLGSRLR